jgi:3-methyladenine DNA glycosylase AlkD
MELDSVLRALRAKGKAGTAAIYRKHGVHDDTYGVSFADLTQLKRQLEVDHELALGLWESGVHDARVLATMIADDEGMTSESIERWLGDCDNHVIQDALSSLAGRMPEALELAGRWSARKEEWPAATGWTVYAVLANRGALPPREASRLLSRIRKGIGKAPNRVRHSMNNALIAIGGGVAELSDAAFEVARAIGRVDVDHGDTGCKTPSAEPYIARMLARKRKTKRVPAGRKATPRKTV